MIERIWKYRERFYITLMIGLAIHGAYFYIQSLKKEDSQFIKDFRLINASFWPVDITPHPNLPEPYYPVPGKPIKPNDPKILIEIA